MSDYLDCESRDLCDDVRDKLSMAQAEIERLRVALIELATLGEEGMKPDYGEWLTFHDKVAQVARRALVDEQKVD